MEQGTNITTKNKNDSFTLANANRYDFLKLRFLIQSVLRLFKVLMYNSYIK